MGKFSQSSRLGALAPDVPPDMFAALGAFDQKIYVIPSMDLVVVRLGGEARESALAVGIFDNLLLGRICHAFGYGGQEQDLTPGFRLSPTDCTVDFPAWNGRRYRLRETTDLDSWTAPAGFEEILGDGSTVTLSRPLDRPRFFQVESWFEAAP